MTRFDDARLNGRQPEFSRMSRQNGGLGLSAMHDVASVFLQFDLEKSEADVPSALREGKSTYRPLGKYLRKKLRKMVGWDEKIPDEILAEYEAEVRALYSDIWNSSPEDRGYKTVKDAFREALVAKERGAINTLLARAEIFKQRKRL